MIIGITGKVGSGKTTLSNMIADKYDIVKLDCDKIAKELILKNNYKINIDKDGFIDSLEQERIKKEFHPLVWNDIKIRINNIKNENRKTNILIETALPNEEFFNIVDIPFFIKSDNIFDRLKNDRNYDDEKISNILKAQECYDKYYDKCDFIILNNDDLNNTFKKIVDIYENLVKID